MGALDLFAGCPTVSMGDKQVQVETSAWKECLVTKSNSRFAMAYVFLVALPVLGLAGILRSGRNLAAPISVGGAWEVQVDAGKLAALPCGKSVAADLATGFAITQSGKNFTLSFANRPAASTGVLEGTSVGATVSPSAAGCGDHRLVSLAATVNTQANLRSLEGNLTVNDCPSCSPVEFRAIRKDQTGSKGVH